MDTTDDELLTDTEYYDVYSADQSASEHVYWVE